MLSTNLAARDCQEIFKMDLLISRCIEFRTFNLNVNPFVFEDWNGQVEALEEEFIHQEAVNEGPSEPNAIVWKVSSGFGHGEVEVKDALVNCCMPGVRKPLDHSILLLVYFILKSEISNHLLVPPSIKWGKTSCVLSFDSRKML